MKAIFERAQARCQEAFARIEDIETYNTSRVLEAYSNHQVGQRHFAPSTGYGYDDVGRDTLESLFADLFHAQAAIVRPHIASGTHALALCLFGLLRPGDELLYVTGAPYDTLEEVIGIRGCPPGSLREMGVRYGEVALKEGKIDVESVMERLTPQTRVVAVQRSRGYAQRPSLMPGAVHALAQALHAARPDVFLMVDNCYGEFVCQDEPTDWGADVCVGSLIKNPGGGLAPTGGYVVGRAEAVERIAYRLTAPGIGREVGSYAASYQPFYQGLFLAPHTVAQAVKTATLAAAVCQELGLSSTPAPQEERSDIIEALQLGTPQRLVCFCQGIQSASPVDSMALPEPWDMPGYQHQVIMAAGTFVSGASIEISADAPMRPPYEVYLQGGLSYAHGKLALMRAFGRMREHGLI